MGARAHADRDSLWAVRPTAVLICTPTALHAADAREAVAAGAHVLVEKPIATDLGDADALVEAARASGRVVAVGYNLRFQRGLKEVRELVRGGAIGRVLTIRAEFGHYLPDWHPGDDYRARYSARAELGGGVLFDLSHEIDLVRWIAGEVAGVCALTATVGDLEIDVEDCALLLLRLASGVLAEIHIDYIQRAYSRGCKIVGSEGTLIWEYPYDLRLFRAAGGWENRSEPVDPNEMYVAELRNFLDCVAGTARVEVDGTDARQTLAVALAAKRSAREGRFVAV